LELLWLCGLGQFTSVNSFFGIDFEYEKCYICLQVILSIMKLFIVLEIIFLSVYGYSQSANVIVHKDSRLDNFIKQRGMIIPPATSPQMSGYRIQLIFDSNKKIVDDARSKFISQHPKVDTYISYNAPHFTLKVGDFRSKQDAEKIKDELMRDFPTCFIVKETINLPRID